MLLVNAAGHLEASLLLTERITQLRVSLPFFSAEARVSEHWPDVVRKPGTLWRRGSETVLQEELRDPLVTGARRWCIATVGLGE